MGRTAYAIAEKRFGVVNILAFMVMMTANALSIFLPLNNKTQMQLSEQYPNLFTPAGFTFSIWGLIYTFLLGFIIYQAIVLFAHQHQEKGKILAVSPLFIGTCVCNAAWLFAWHYEFVPLSVIIMLIYLCFLVLIHDRLSFAIAWKPLQPKLWLDITFSIYLGWICVATIANITALCIREGFTLPVLSPHIWTIVMLGTAALIGLFYVFTRNNKFVALVIIWAFYGIISKRNETGGQNSHAIVLAAEVCIGVLLLIIVSNILRRR